MADVDEASHRRVTDVWRPPGMGACYRAACSCGWVSSTPEVGYGYPISHDEDFSAHYAKATEEGEERVEYDTIRSGYMGGDGNVTEEIGYFCRTVRTWTTPDGATGTLVGPWVEVEG